MSFQVRYNSLRAADIADGNDAFVYAGATALRVVSTRPTVTQQQQQQQQPAPATETVKPAPKSRARSGAKKTTAKAADETDSATTETSMAFLGVRPQRRVAVPNASAMPTSDDVLVKEALTRGCRLRRPRTAAVEGEGPYGEMPPPPRTVLLSSVELQRLQNAVSSKHVTASRADAQSLYDKLSDRLAKQRIAFVNQLVGRKGTSATAGADGSDDVAGDA